MAFSSQQPSANRSSGIPIRFIVLCLLLVLVAGYWGFTLGTNRPDRAVEAGDPQRAQQLFDAGQYEDAEKLAVATAESIDRRFYLLAADSASRLGAFERAFEYWSNFDGVGGPYETAANLGRAETFYRQGKLSEAEAAYRGVIAMNPTMAQAHRGLVFLYAMSGLSYKVPEHTFALLRQGEQFLEAVALLADSDAVLEPPEEISGEGLETDSMLLVGFARRARKTEGNKASAKVLLRLFEREDCPPESYTELGMLWEEDVELLKTWLEHAPVRCESVPDYWYLAGRVAEYEDLLPEAIWCYVNCLDRHYDHLRATYALAQAAKKLGVDETTEVYANRADRIHYMVSRAQRAFRHRKNPGWSSQLAMAALELGRYWEAVAWAEISLKITQQYPEPIEVIRQAAPLLNANTPLTDPGLPERRAMANKIATPWPRLQNRTPNREVLVAKLSEQYGTLGSDGQLIASQSAASNSSGAGIRFRDDTSTAGLTFQYNDTADIEDIGRLMYEFTCTGVSVIDYDGDGRPDVMFPQSSPNRPGSGPQGDRPDGDALFRTFADSDAAGGARLIDVTLQARLSSPGFGQGAAVGDFDGDGFPDLYVSQIRRNRLLLNNGDGTFRDVSDDIGLESTSWTVSAAIADIDGDSFADLFDVNYIGGPELYSRTCSNGEQRLSCSPLGFPPEPDRLLAGTGWLGVDDVSVAAGIHETDANGLGIVVGLLDDDSKLDVFVANDLTENHLFVNLGQPGKPKFSDEALFRGAALNRHAETEACMGVAAGDVDQDGRTDLFITNFYEESNTLYMQRDDGILSDETARFNLVEPGLRLLGFGAQFLDADLDGLDDLVITNGHVDDQPGVPFEMRPLAFRNVGNRFESIANSSIGEFFEGEYVGRGLSRLDWNEDGRDDFVVTHLTSPATLLTNETSTKNHSLKIAVRATQSHRDAIGARLACEVVDGAGTTRTMFRHQTAGDGYEATNERLLTFGIHEDESVVRLTVQWPSGTTDTFDNVPVSGRFVSVEGLGRLVAVPETRYAQ